MNLLEHMAQCDRVAEQVNANGHFLWGWHRIECDRVWHSVAICRQCGREVWQHGHSEEPEGRAARSGCTHPHVP